MEKITFEVGGQKYTAEIPAGGESGGIATLEKKLPSSLFLYNEDGKLILKELSPVINGFIEAIERAGKAPQQVYLLVGSRRLECLFLHRQPYEGEKPELMLLAG
jgi:hypothetical protein